MRKAGYLYNAGANAFMPLNGGTALQAPLPPVKP